MERQIKEYRQAIEKYEQQIEASAGSNSSRSGRYVPPSPSHSRENKYGATNAIYLNQMGDDIDYKSPTPSPGPPSPSTGGGNYDIQDDINDISTWLNARSGDKKKDHKFFNKKMMELCTKRTDAHRLQIAQIWLEKEGKPLSEMIDRKLDGKTKGIYIFIFIDRIQK